jgi:hypothetical protein
MYIIHANWRLVRKLRGPFLPHKPSPPWSAADLAGVCATMDAPSMASNVGADAGHGAAQFATDRSPVACDTSRHDLAWWKA